MLATRQGHLFFQRPFPPRIPTGASVVKSWQGAAQGSMFTDPSPLYRAGQDGQGSLSAGDLHTKVIGPWGLPTPPKSAPPTLGGASAPSPAQAVVWPPWTLSVPRSPCLSHLGPDLLPLCFQGFPIALVSPPHLSPAQLQPPSPGKCSLPCVHGVTLPGLSPPPSYPAQLTR